MATSRDDVLADALLRARATWPDLAVSDDDYACFVENREPAAHAADLYLACALARRDPAAVRAFEERVLPAIEVAVKHLGRDADFVAEVRQRVRAQLLVGEAPGIREYGGRGALAAWVRVVAVRVALQMLRTERSSERRTSGLADEPELPRFDAELELIKARYREPFRNAFTAALRELTPHERNLMSLHVLEGLSLSQIGGLHGVNKSTVSRWIAAANTRLEAGIRTRLRADLGVPDDELDSLIAMLRSRIDLSVERVLRDADADPT